MSCDWIMAVFGNRQLIVTSAGYSNDPRKPSAKNWCVVFLMSLEWRIMLHMCAILDIDFSSRT